MKIRFTAIIILVIMLSSLLAACGNTGAGGGTSAEQTTGDAHAGTAAVTESPYDKNGYLKDSLPELNFGGETVGIAYWSDAEHIEFTTDGINGEAVNDAIYARNTKVAERLGVTLNYIGIAGNTSNINNFVKRVTADAQSNDKDFQLIGAYSRTAASLAVHSLLQDLAGMSVIDYEKPWWPDNLLVESTVNGKLLFISGDISTNLLNMMYVTFFNKTLLTSHNLESPYDLVNGNKWTLEKMLELASGFYGDTNLNSKKDDGDTFGFMSSRLHIDPFYAGCGLRTVERNADGDPVVSGDFCGEKNERVVEILGSFLHNTDDGFYTVASSGVPAQKAFAEERALFISDRARTAYFEPVKSSNVSFGIVPMPKYNADQDGYYTAVGFPYTLYCIPASNASPETAATVLECLASESYRQVTPQLFELTMKIRYADDAVVAGMYDIIRDGVSFDLGRIYCDSVDNLSLKVFRDSVAKNTPALASLKAAYDKLFNGYLEDIRKAYN